MNTTQREIQTYAATVQEWWLAQKQTDKTFTKADLFVRFPDLGSDKTFGRFLKGDFADTDTTLDAWHAAYAAVVRQLEEFGERDRSAGAVDTLTLSGLEKAKEAYLALTGETTSRRLLVVTGESGTGKTCIVNFLQKRWGSRVRAVEVTNVWQDKPNRLLTAIAEAVGLNPAGLPASGAEKLDLLVKHLNARRTCLILEEGHHMGPQMLDTLKTLLNKTPGEFIVVAIPTLLRRLQMAAYEQARQVFNSHRLAGTLTLKLQTADVAALLTAGLGELPGLKALADWLCDPARAPRHGNLGFIRDVVATVATARAKAGEETITAATVQRAANEVISRR